MSDNLSNINIPEQSEAISSNKNSAIEWEGIESSPEYSSLSVKMDKATKSVRCAFTHVERQNVTKGVLSEGEDLYQRIANASDEKFGSANYFVLTTDHPKVFSYGGDFTLFLECIDNRDLETLTKYGEQCINSVWMTYNRFGRNVTSIAGIKGEAFGGGLECTLGCDWLIAERDASIALPESVFGMFPGMGAHSFLARRIGLRRTEELIISGRKISGEQAYELGIIDEVCETGGLDKAISRFIHACETQGRDTAMMKLKPGPSKPKLAKFISYAKRYHPRIEKTELIDLVREWAKSSLKITEREQKLMKRLLAKQKSRAVNDVIVSMKPGVEREQRDNPFRH